MDHPSHDSRDATADLPRIPGPWSGIYAAVLCYLLILIAGLYAFSRFFSY